MCTNCGYNPCHCQSPGYTYNWNNIENYPCNPCSTTQVCKKFIPAFCTMYKGPNLDNLGLNTNTGISIELIFTTLNTIVGNINTAFANANFAQATKNTNILAALNDINDRLNVLEGASHAPYSI